MRVAAGLMVGLLACSALAPASWAGPAPSARSVKEVGRPLVEVLASLSRDGVVYAPSDELAQVKVSVVAPKPEPAALPGRLAGLLGAEWRPGKKDGAEARILHRRPAVDRWLETWRREKREAVRAAREYQEASIHETFRQAFAGLDKPRATGPDGKPERPPFVGQIPLARLVQSLPASRQDELVRWLAAGSPIRVGGEWDRRPPALAIPFRDLNPAQQGLVREWLGSEDVNAPAAEIADLPNALVSFGCQAGAFEVGVFLPASRRAWTNHAVGGYRPEHMVEAELYRVLYRRMAAHATPPDALLGARPTDKGTAEPAVSIADEGLAGRPLPRLPVEPLSWELLPVVAAAAGLELVADHHTRSARLRLPAPSYTLRQVLELAAERYQLVFRVEGGCLMARNRLWPDRDEEETPAPHPERWLALKLGGESLAEADLTVLGGLSEARLDGLNAYRDGPVNFTLEVHAARRHRWVWGLMASLTADQRRRAHSPAGLPLRSLDLRTRNFVIQHADVPARWDRIHLYVEEAASRHSRAGFVMVQLRDHTSDTPVLHVWIPAPGG
jgi:hypothetical protein